MNNCQKITHPTQPVAFCQTSILATECKVQFVMMWYSDLFFIFSRNILREKNLCLSWLIFFRNLPIQSEQVHIFVKNPKLSLCSRRMQFDNPAEKFLLKI